MDENIIEQFARKHPVGFCKIPEGLDSLPSLGATKRFCAPHEVTRKDYLGPTEDQGEKPWCAAYAAANWAEGILWQKNGYYEQIDPTWIYKWAKAHDGDPNGDGTTLIAVLEALLEKGVFDRKVCKVRTIRPNVRDVKYALHRFGMFLVGLNITRQWYSCAGGKFEIDDSDRMGIGGHALIACGYDDTHVTIQNSWGSGFGWYGFCKVKWEAFIRQMMYGAVLSNCLNGMDV